MKKLKNMDYLLSLGVFILQFAGYSLTFNEMIPSNGLRCLILFILAVMSFSLSFIFKKLLEVDVSSKVSYALGAIGLVNSFISLGAYKILGSWFSFTGDGVAIFFASIFILIGVLAILTAVLYKNYNFIHLAYISVIGMIISFLVYFKVDYYYIFLIAAIILLVLNLFKKMELTYEFSTIGIIIVSGLCVIAYDKGLVLSGILFLVNIISLIRVLLNKREFEYQLLGVIVLVGITTVFTMITPEVMKESLAVIVATSIVLILELVMSTLRVLDKKFVKLFYKVLSLILLAIIVLASEFNTISHLIAILFIIGVSIVDTFAIHNDDYEKYFLPFKILFISYFFAKLLNNDAYLPIAYGVQAILFATVYRLFKNKNTRVIYAIVLALSLLLAAGYMEKSLATNIFAIVSLFVTFIIFSSKDDDLLSNIFYGALLFTMVGMESSTSFLEVLVMVLVLGLMTFIKRNNKFCFGASMFLLIWFVRDFLSLAIKHYDTYIILAYFMALLMLGIISEVLFKDKQKAKNIFASIAITICLLCLLGDADSFATHIFALLASLVIILVSIRSEEYKTLYNIGFVFIVLFLISLLGSFDNIPTALYLLIISFVIIVVVSFMIYRFNKNKDQILAEEKRKAEEKKKVIRQYQINFCGECGNKINNNDIYCSECGTKVR